MRGICASITISSGPHIYVGFLERHSTNNDANFLVAWHNDANDNEGNSNIVHDQITVFNYASSSEEKKQIQMQFVSK